MKRRVMLAGQRLLGATGVGELYARCKRPDQAIVLMYHSVCDDARASWIAPRNRMATDLFEQQLARLARSGRVVSISQLADAAMGKPLNPGSIVLTFDDGYLDNLDVIAPLLDRYKLPAVLYLATAYVADAAPQWADVVHAAIEHRNNDQLSMPGLGDWNLSDSKQRDAANYLIGRMLILMDRSQRAGVLGAIAEQLDSPPCEMKLTMSFDDVRRIADQYPSFELGVHTADHLDLSAQPIDAAIAEIRRSMEMFRNELGRDAVHFSFPYSRSTQELIDRLDGTGLQTAMTGEGVVSLKNFNPLDIHRLESPTSMALFRYWISGAHPMLTRTLFRRD